MLIDTHVHFDLMNREPPETVIARAAAAGVEKMVAVGGTAEANKIALQVAKNHPRNIRAAIGLDRHQAELNPALAEFERTLAENNAAAIGETGLDFHHERPGREAQINLFRHMLKIARARQKPVIVHNRGADSDLIAILAEHARSWQGPAGKIGVCHCFTGSKEFAERVLELGFSISFSGIITFQKSRSSNNDAHAGLIEAARAVPEDRLLVETDSPFLAPVPLRGRPNEPANVRYTAQALALIRNCPLESIASVTTQNAERLFFNEA